jgi:hypothetical protein
MDVFLSGRRNAEPTSLSGTPDMCAVSHARTKQQRGQKGACFDLARSPRQRWQIVAIFVFVRSTFTGNEVSMVLADRFPTSHAGKLPLRTTVCMVISPSHQGRNG